MNLIKILAFLFIFGLVMNGLAALNILSTSFTSDSSMDTENPDAQLNALTTLVTGGLILALAGAMIAWIALSSVNILGSGTSGAGAVPMDKLFGYTIFGGLITLSLWGGINTIWNIYEIIPEEARLGATVMLSIIIAIIGFVVTLGFVELTTGRDLS